MLIIVDAVNLLRNFLVRTYKISNGCQHKQQLEKKYSRKVYDSLTLLTSEMQLNLIELTKESRRTLSKFSKS